MSQLHDVKHELKSNLSFAQISKSKKKNPPIRVLTCTQTFNRRRSRRRHESKNPPLPRQPQSPQRPSLPDQRAPTQRDACWSGWRWRPGGSSPKAPATPKIDPMSKLKANHHETSPVLVWSRTIASWQVGPLLESVLRVGDKLFTSLSVFLWVFYLCLHLEILGVLAAVTSFLLG